MLDREVIGFDSLDAFFYSPAKIGGKGTCRSK